MTFLSDCDAAWLVPNIIQVVRWSNHAMQCPSAKHPKTDTQMEVLFREVTGSGICAAASFEAHWISLGAPAIVHCAATACQLQDDRGNQNPRPTRPTKTHQDHVQS